MSNHDAMQDWIHCGVHKRSWFLATHFQTNVILLAYEKAESCGDGVDVLQQDFEKHFMKFNKWRVKTKSFQIKFSLRDFLAASPDNVLRRAEKKGIICY